jgi:hypothetical protein
MRGTVLQSSPEWWDGRAAHLFLVIVEIGEVVYWEMFYALQFFVLKSKRSV